VADDVSAALQDALSGPPGLDTLGDFIDLLRPSRRGAEPDELPPGILEALGNDAALRTRLAACVRVALRDLGLAPVLIESGVLKDRGVIATVGAGFGDWVLPPVFPADDARSAIPRVFRHRADFRWVRSVSIREWAQLIELALPGEEVEPLDSAELRLALQKLAQRISAAGTDAEIEARYRWAEHHAAPFRDLPLATRSLFAALDEGEGQPAVEQLLVEVRAARQVVRELREEQPAHGTSLRLTRLTRRLNQQLRRFELLCRLICPRDRGQLSRSLAVLLKDLLAAEQSGKRLRTRIGQGVDLLAYQVTEHTAAKGEKYISGARKAYWKVLRAALVGGALVGVFAIFKLLGKKLSLPLAGEALVYGLNYAVCFVLIYAFGATLATKQPAITASALAKQLDAGASRADGLHEVARSVERIWRTQFVSFLGNLLFAFPFAALVGFAIERSAGFEVVTPDKAQELLAANHPFEGPTLAYAAIAGVFLFVAGLVQGAVDNRVIYTRLEARLAEHPRLRFLGGRQAGFASWVGAHAGGIASNVLLGFLLGSAGVFGRIFGLPIDIRHIAFSSAHVGVAVLDAPELVDGGEAAIVILGVLAIGFVNFLVSFGLTLVMSMKSRQVTVDQGFTLLLLLVRRFVRSPAAWFLPVEKQDPDKEPATSADAAELAASPSGEPKNSTG